MPVHSDLISFKMIKKPVHMQSTFFRCDNFGMTTTGRSAPAKISTGKTLVTRIRKLKKLEKAHIKCLFFRYLQLVFTFLPLKKMFKTLQSKINKIKIKKLAIVLQTDPQLFIHKQVWCWL